MSEHEPTNRSLRERELTVVMIGFGRRANEHVDSLRTSDGLVEIRAVCDSDPVARANARRRLPEAVIGSDLSSTLGRARCDLAVICLPPNVSRDFLGELSNYGLRAVLVEKPAAMDAESVRKVFGGISVPVHLFHQMRLLPWAVRVRDWLRERREEGQSVRVEASCYGKLYDQGLHLLDLAAHFLGSLPETIDRLVVEDDPARMSARKPLPVDWRIDHHHPGPLAVEIEAGWTNGDTFRIRCGPGAADGWLDKQLVLSAGDHRITFGTRGIVSEADGQEEREISGDLDEYLGATAGVYLQFRDWLVGGKELPEVPSIAEHIEQLEWCERALGHPDRERFPKPAWLVGKNQRLPIQVVIPLSDHRGVAEMCVRSWTESQAAPPATFRLILVSNDETRALGESLRPFLRSHDTVVDSGLPQAEMGQGDMEEYVRGIDAGDSEWIFLTEPHCEVPPDAASELIRFFEESEAAGFCTGCIDKVETPWGAMEALYSDEGFETWKAPGHWSKMIMRGFGIRRTAYERAGGFRLRYGRFSEWLLAADLHRRGFYLDFAPGVRVIHHYTPDKAYLDEAIEEFVIGQARYLVEIPEEERLPYFFSPSIEIPPDGDLSRHFARLRKVARKQRIRRTRTLRLSPSTLLWIRREWNAAIVRLSAGWAPGFAYPFFKRYYESQNDRSLLVHYANLSARRERSFLTVGKRFEVEEKEFDAVAEMNQLEKWNGMAFRWSRPNFAIHLRSEPGEKSSIHLGYAAGIAEVDRERVVGLLDHARAGAIVPSRGESDREGEAILVFDLPEWEKPFSGWLAIACELIDAPGDDRDLGLPLRSISLRRR